MHESNASNSGPGGEHTLSSTAYRGGDLSGGSVRCDLAGFLLHMRPAARRSPTVAVVRFDNETNDPVMSRFGDELTDSIVERLTSLGNARYSVIGNAQILRVPRSERNLNAIAQSLNTEFIVLGQIQAYHGQTRILVHLIHMPEQTHVSVARVDRTLKNPLDLEAEVAQKVAMDFSSHLVAASASSAAPTR